MIKKIIVVSCFLLTWFITENRLEACAGWAVLGIWGIWLELEEITNKIKNHERD